MRTRAAVASAVGAPVIVEDLVLSGPRRGEVLVRVGAAGVCHTDYHYLRGDLACPMPVVPGHEGAGVVEAVGDGVGLVRPGDAVCFMWRPRCGHCPACLSGRPVLCPSGMVHAASGGLLDGTTRLQRPSGDTVHHLLGVSCFAEYAVVSERAVVPVPDDVPPEVAAITGCAVVTGVGAVLHAIGACAGQALLVMGAGGVGLSAVLGAVLAGADPVVVADVVPERLAAAKRLGATHTVDVRRQPLMQAIEDIRPGGVDWAVEAIGRPDTVAQAFDALRPGGTLVAVGLGPRETTVPIPLNPLVQREKRIVGSLYGSANPLLDVPRLLALYRSGRLPIDQLIGQRYGLDDIGQAFSDLVGGSVGRGVVLMGGLQ